MKRLRILYVEDNPANLMLVERVASMGGHEVLNRSNGERALADFEEIKPDLLLMDLQLSGAVDGLEVVQTLRKRGYNGPIVAVTAYAMVGDRERALEAGCNEYLAKPLPITKLVAVLQRYAEGRPAPEPPPKRGNPKPPPQSKVTQEIPRAEDSEN